jgi:hypothetical protein
MPDTEKQPQPKRYCVEYRETPFDGKARVVNNIVSALDAKDLEKQFWANPTWAGRGVKKVEILQSDCIDE